VRRTGMGEIVPPADPAALAAALVRVIQQRQHYVRSRDQVAQTFDLLQSVRRYEALFAELLPADTGARSRAMR
jgi:glycosyltransferase involved in cell wall biosynthesis